jgi:hypothetical protein
VQAFCPADVVAEHGADHTHGQDRRKVQLSARRRVAGHSKRRLLRQRETDVPEEDREHDARIAPAARSRRA